MDPNQDYERKLLKLERRARKRRTSYRLLFLLILLGLFAIMLAELGRTLAVSKEIGRFIQQFEERSPTEVREALHRYARRFHDHNPIIRQASMTVFKFVTREEFGNDLEAWERWWLENRATWEYVPPPSPPTPLPIIPRDDLTPVPVPESRPQHAP